MAQRRRPRHRFLQERLLVRASDDGYRPLDHSSRLFIGVSKILSSEACSDSRITFLEIAESKYFVKSLCTQALCCFSSLTNVPLAGDDDRRSQRPIAQLCLQADRLLHLFGEGVRRLPRCAAWSGCASGAERTRTPKGSNQITRRDSLLDTVPTCSVPCCEKLCSRKKNMGKINFADCQPLCRRRS